MRKPSLLVIFLTVFIDLLGFGIVVPLVPAYALHLGAHGAVNGVIIASFSIMQFLFSPIWGRLSDKHGRRPILLLSTAGAAVSYLLFAWASGLKDHTTALLLIVLSRSLAGVCGGNIAVAQAYMADITPPEKRSRSMGLIGMAFGLGFIFGPWVGAESLKRLGETGPGFVAAAICASNFLLALMVLAESRKAGSTPVAHRPHLEQWRHTLSRPKVGLLIVVFFLTTFCFSCFESTLALMVAHNFGLDFKKDATTAAVAGYLFVYCGVIGAVIQGGAIGPLVKRLGESKLIALSLLLTAASMAWLPFIKGGGTLSWGILTRPEGAPWLWLLASLGLLSIATSLTRPPLFGYISILTPESEQGVTIGVAQSAGSLARIPGPIFALALLEYVPPLPYVICAALLLVTAWLVIRKLCRNPIPAG
jgi:MFS family permease